jgi:hypothetical protein
MKAGESNCGNLRCSVLLNCLMVMTGNEKTQSEVVVTTSQGCLYFCPRPIAATVILKIKVFWHVMLCHIMRKVLDTVHPLTTVAHPRSLEP